MGQDNLAIFNFIAETLCCWSLMESHISAFEWCKNHSTWMTLNGYYALCYRSTHHASFEFTPEVRKKIDSHYRRTKYSPRKSTLRRYNNKLHADIRGSGDGAETKLVDENCNFSNFVHHIFGPLRNRTSRHEMPYRLSNDPAMRDLKWTWDSWDAVLC